MALPDQKHCEADELAPRSPPARAVQAAMKCFLQRQRGAAIAAQSHDDLSRGGLAQPGLLGPGGPTAPPPMDGPAAGHCVMD